MKLHFIAILPILWFCVMYCRLGQSFVVRRPFGMSAMSLSSKSSKIATPYTVTKPPQLDLAALTTTAFSGDLLVIPFYKPAALSAAGPESAQAISAALKRSIPELPVDLKTLVTELLDEREFKGEAATKQVVRAHGLDSKVKYVALVGLGANPKKEGGAGEMKPRTAARLGRAVASIAKEVSAQSVGISLLPGTDNGSVNPLLLGVHDELYVDERFKKVPEGGFPQSKWKTLTLLNCPATVADHITLTGKLSAMIASGVLYAKDLVGAPPCSKTPIAIAESVVDMAKEHNLEVKVLGQAECEELGMGGYLGVQKGSKFPPQFVHLTYRPSQPSADTVKVALIGKGLTFDSGGYNLKAGAGSMIELMKFDMGGCAAVFGTAKAIAQLRPKNLEVHFISAVCENMVSAEAMRPGDVLVASNGKTIEVINTDAEGRLTLADALVYAEKLQVDAIVDLATLTGASIVGLGEKVGALYSSDESLLRELQQAAARSGEKVWHMPLESEYRSSIKGSITDLLNLSKAKGGGSITAALFLQEFVEKTPWAHLDMAGPVWGDNGPTGYGVKLLVDYLLNVKKSEQQK